MKVASIWSVVTESALREPVFAGVVFSNDGTPRCAFRFFFDLVMSQRALNVCSTLHDVLSTDLLHSIVNNFYAGTEHAQSNKGRSSLDKLLFRNCTRHLSDRL